MVQYYSYGSAYLSQQPEIFFNMKRIFYAKEYFNVKYFLYIKEYFTPALHIYLNNLKYSLKCDNENFIIIIHIVMISRPRRLRIFRKWDKKNIQMCTSVNLPSEPEWMNCGIC